MLCQKLLLKKKSENIPGEAIAAADLWGASGDYGSIRAVVHQRRK